VIRELTASVEDAVAVEDLQGVQLYGNTGTMYKIRCVAVVDVEADDNELEGNPSYCDEDGTVCRTATEEWVVYRSFRDFQQLHKHLKQEVSAYESSGTAGSRLVGAAAAFAAGSISQGRSRQRGPLVPSLAQASKVGALGVTQRSLMKRKEAFDAYLKYILSSGHFLRRSAEILLFLGASFPLPPEVRPGVVVAGVLDPLGRTEMTRTIVASRTSVINNVEGNEQDNDDSVVRDSSRSQKTAESASTVSRSSLNLQEDEESEELESGEQTRKSQSKNVIAAIQNKIVKVPLSQVRTRIFELLRYQFGFENASFLRSRMLAALKTVSFAVTTNSEFQRTLYKVHTEQISAVAIAGWIDFALNMLWPDGVFFESAPPTSAEQLEADSKKARKVLHESFPEQVRAVLGQDLTRDGLDIFHEMLQNRIVMKSMSYMFFDLLWLEVFPEIGDVLDCGRVLDISDQ